MFSTTSFKNTSRAAIAALVIGAASISAMPAQAASTNFGFSFNAGNGLSFSIDEGQRNRHDGPRRFERVCLSDNQIRRDLRNSGFDNIRFGRERRGSVQVVAERGRWEYVLKVDRCDGQVATVDRQRMRQERRNGPSFRFNVR